MNRRLRAQILRKDLGLAPATTRPLSTQIARGWVNWRSSVSLPPPPSRAFCQMSSDCCRVDPPPPGVLTSALSALQGRFAPVTTPVGGTAAGRGEHFVLSLFGGGYVDPGGGLSGRGPLGGSSASGGTILGSRANAGGSTAYEVMDDEYRNQVISPVTTEEAFFPRLWGLEAARRPVGSSGLLPSRGHQRKTHPQVPPTGQRIARGSRWRCCCWGGSWAAPLARAWRTHSHRVPPRERLQGPGPDSAAIARFLKVWRIPTSAQEPRPRRGRETSSCTAMIYRTAIQSAAG